MEYEKAEYKKAAQDLRKKMVSAEKKCRNPGAEQSRIWLIEALYALMKTMPFAEITVVAVCSQADLSRRTFYRCFDSKEDLFDEACSRLCREYVSFLDRDLTYSMTHFVEVYFTFWEGHKDILRLICDNQLICRLTDISNRFWPEIYCRFEAYWKDTMTDQELEYCLAFNLGGLWNTLLKWLLEEPHKSPEQAAEVIRRSLGNLVKNL